MNRRAAAAQLPFEPVPVRAIFPGFVVTDLLSTADRDGCGRKGADVDWLQGARGNARRALQR